MSEKQCVNCPGAVDHSTAECPLRATAPVGVPDDDGLAPGYGDGHDWEGFPGGCARLGCSEGCSAALSAQQSDPWAPSDADYDHAIHRNPDARAWADFFVATFPGQADKHDLMIGWFANAMMAMHDHLKAQQPEFCCELSYKAAKEAAWGARDLTQCKCDHNEYCDHCWPADFRPGGKWHGKFVARQSAHVSVPRELLERICWSVISSSDLHTHNEAVRELHALLNGGEA